MSFKVSRRKISVEIRKMHREREKTDSVPLCYILAIVASPIEFYMFSSAHQTCVCVCICVWMCVCVQPCAVCVWECVLMCGKEWWNGWNRYFMIIIAIRCIVYSVLFCTVVRCVVCACACTHSGALPIHSDIASMYTHIGAMWERVHLVHYTLGRSTLILFCYILSPSSQCLFCAIHILCRSVGRSVENVYVRCARTRNRHTSGSKDRQWVVGFASLYFYTPSSFPSRFFLHSVHLRFIF